MILHIYNRISDLHSFLQLVETLSIFQLTVWFCCNFILFLLNSLTLLPQKKEPNKKHRQATKWRSQRTRKQTRENRQNKVMSAGLSILSCWYKRKNYQCTTNQPPHKETLKYEKQIPPLKGQLQSTHTHFSYENSLVQKFGFCLFFCWVILYQFIY